MSFRRDTGASGPSGGARCLSRPILPWVVLLHLATSPAAASEPGTQAKTPGGASTASGSHPAKSLTAQAGDPTAPLMQIQLTNFHSPDVRNGDGYYNLLNFQPVVPVPDGSLIPVKQVMRLTVPYVTTPDPDRESGLGDISYFDLFVVTSNPKNVLGLGFTTTLPTAADSQLGAGSWQIGPAASWVTYEIENWQIGAILQNPISVAGEGNRESVNMFELQPIVNYLWGNWYFGAGDFNAIWDWERNEATVPLAFQVGKIQKMGGHKVNLSAELEWTAIYPDDAVVPRWGIRVGFVLLLPE